MKPPLLQVGVSIFNYVCVEDTNTYVVLGGFATLLPKV